MGVGRKLTVKNAMYDQLNSASSIFKLAKIQIQNSSIAK